MATKETKHAWHSGIAEQGPRPQSVRCAVQQEGITPKPRVIGLPATFQHSVHIKPGREGLFDLVKGLPPTLRYEPERDRGRRRCRHRTWRFSGFGQPVNWVAADILRIENGILTEHWDVIQDEATRDQSKSGLPCLARALPR